MPNASQTRQAKQAENGADFEATKGNTKAQPRTKPAQKQIELVNERTQWQMQPYAHN